MRPWAIAEDEVKVAALAGRVEVAFSLSKWPPRAGTPASANGLESAWPATATTATFPEAVPENEEVVPVNAVSTWVLLPGVTVGR